jgi:TRAP-type C4-dicarboxylate transport system substrate-binding protein
VIDAAAGALCAIEQATNEMGMTFMKNVTVFFLSCLLALFQFNGAAFAQAPVTLRFAEIHEPAYPTTVGDYQLAKLVKERTHGRVIFEVYDSMKLGDEAVVIKKVQDGDIDLTRINIGPVTRYVPLLNALLMPYIFRDVPHMLKVVNGPIGNEVVRSADKNDGAENNYPTYLETKHYQLAPYFIEDAHTRLPDIIIGSKKALASKLSAKEIEIIKQATRDAQTLQFRLWAKADKAAKDAAVAGGATVTVPTAAQQKEFVTAVNPIYGKQPSDIQDLIKKVSAAK